MEPLECGVQKRRGRKRKIKNVQDVTADGGGKRKAVQTRSLKLVGCYVRKSFQDGDMFLGKITFYQSGLYRIHYEDGDVEDLDTGEVKLFLVEDDDLTGEWFEKKVKLDALLLNKDATLGIPKVENGVDVRTVDQADASIREKVNNGDAGHGTQVEAVDGSSIQHNDDSSSDSCEDTRELGGSSSLEEAQSRPPDIPPSSGHIGVPEEYVSHLFSVYSFLRSFSVPLFLYPFGLDEFVGSLNCPVANTLLDSVHVALLRALKRHMERLSSSGSELSMKCMRCMDWSLLDTLTWPIFLVHYLVTMGYVDSAHWKGFCVHVLERDYYSLSAGRKLVILQILCDEVHDSDEVRAEITMREESEVGLDVDGSIPFKYTVGPRRVSSRLPRTTNENMTEQVAGPSVGSVQVEGSIDEDGNGDECCICGMDGLLLCCDGCPLSYHTRCLGVSKMLMREGLWYCPQCIINKAEPEILKGTRLRGGHYIGADRHGLVFVATCDHLLVFKASFDSGVCVRYYNRQDIPRVLQSLYSNADDAFIYSEICRGMVQYWELPDDILPNNLVSETSSLIESDKRCDAYTNTSDNITGKLMPDMSAVEKDGLCYANSITVADPAKASLSICIQNPVISGNSLSSQTGLDEVGNGDSKGNPFQGCIYMGTSFKIAGYVNSFIHGDFAASAAANLSIFSSEENHTSESRSLSNHRKFMSDNAALQVKAFSLAANRFFWPISERKLAEVPRERCSWCLFCKATAVSKKGCLLNAAASNAIKGTAKALPVVRPSKNGDGRLADISHYMLFMEESLSGLVVGPFLHDTFRESWRKQVEHAATYGEVKTLLLEFEENIRAVAFSGEWLRDADGSAQLPSCQIAANVSVSVQKHRPGRRGRKPSSMVEESSSDNQDTSDFIWWRGNKSSKLLFLKEVLPSSTTRKAALQCGYKKIPGIHYVDGDDTPKASRQLIWRSAVEKSRNIAGLALQVRYLDSNVRWTDLVRPEQTTVDGKGSDAEASAFRNAFICDKKIVENEIRYCVTFGGQKHLPSRLMKNIAEIEQVMDDGKEKYWFSEARIPLYLIKEYEQKFGRIKSGTSFSRLKIRWQKTHQRNTFLCLWRKQNNIGQINCCSCGQGIFYWNALKCSKCEGFFHKKCATSSTLQQDQDLDLIITCIRCSQISATSQVLNTYGSPTSPLFLQTRDYPHTSTSNRSRSSVGQKGSSASGENGGYHCEMEPTKVGSVGKKKSNKFKHWGLILKKNNSEDTGIDFRLRNIILKGNADRNLPNIVCRLCFQEYNADLMYVRCEACQYWYHADALQLDESMIFSVVGFKCPKCRRIKSPPCPYADPDKKKVSEYKFEDRAPRLETLIMHPEIGPQASNDPLLSSSRFHQYSDLSELDDGWNHSDVSGSGPQKLPVRRQAKQEPDMFSTHALDPFQLNLPTFDATTKKLPVARHVTSENNPGFHPGIDEVSGFSDANDGWMQDFISPQDHLAHSHDDGVVLDYENIGGYDDTEFEPQTYFSFQELLASDDGAVSHGNESSFSAENFQSTPVLSDDGTLEISYDQEEPVISLGTIEILPCKICSRSDPYPDLSCLICGMWIHSHCSPWVETSISEAGWKCGHCCKQR